jgi:hypothetical protein
MSSTAATTELVQKLERFRYSCGRTHDLEARFSQIFLDSSATIASSSTTSAKAPLGRFLRLCGLVLGQSTSGCFFDHASRTLKAPAQPHAGISELDLCIETAFRQTANDGRTETAACGAVTGGRRGKPGLPSVAR